MSGADHTSVANHAHPAGIQDMGLVRYRLQDTIATIELDDGKRNALSPAMLRQLNAALDRAEAAAAAVILTGRESVFSAGFDLAVLKRGGIDALRMLGAGYALTARLLTHPYPVIAACNGHALAMGVFLLLSCDYVIGIRGDFKLAANEVAIGLPMPRVAAAMLRNRLTPSAFQSAVTLSRYFPPGEALTAGLFDELCEPPDLMRRACTLAEEGLKLDRDAHRISKRRIRRDLVRHVRRSIPLDLFDAVRTGLRASVRARL